MLASVATRLTSRRVSVADPLGHEFEFEREAGAAASPRLYATRWKNNRLPLDAERRREAAAALARATFGDTGPA